MSPDAAQNSSSPSLRSSGSPGTIPSSVICLGELSIGFVQCPTMKPSGAIGMSTGASSSPAVPPSRSCRWVKPNSASHPARPRTATEPNTHRTLRSYTSGHVEDVVGLDPDVQIRPLPRRDRIVADREGLGLALRVLAKQRHLAALREPR